MVGLLSTPLNNVTTTGQFLGDALSGLGAGLLAYGGGGYLRPQAGMIGLQALQQAPQIRQERQMQNLQYALGNQQLQQGNVSNALNNAQTLAMLNWRRTKSGMQPLTMNDLLNNPQQAFQSFGGPAGNVSSQTSLPSNGVLQPLPAGGMMQTGINYQQPQAQPQSISAQPQQTTVTPNIQQSSTQLPSTGVLAQIQDDVLYNPEYAKMEYQIYQNLPEQLRSKATIEQMAKDYRYTDTNGVIQNLPGAVPAGAQVARANSYATSQGSLPATLVAQAQRGAIERQNDINKAGITPITITVPDGRGGFTQVNTNNLAASGGSAGLPVFTEMDKQMVPLLTANIGENQKAAAGARDSLTQIGELRKALQNLPTGPGTEITNEAAAALQRAGIDINVLLPDGLQTDPTKYAVAMKNVNNLGMAVARANFPGGRITNSDLMMAIKTTPNLMNNPQANQILLGNIETIQRLKLDRSEFDNQWLKDHGGVPRLQMEQDWLDKVKGMKNVPDDIKSAFYSFGDLAQNPNAPQTPTMKLPQNAVSSAINPQTNHAIYLYKGANGYFWGDENQRPVQ